MNQKRCDLFHRMQQFVVHNPFPVRAGLVKQNFLGNMIREIPLICASPFVLARQNDIV